MKEIDKCRICGNRELVPVVNLGDLCFTGIFPSTPDEEIPKGRLELVKCAKYKDSCGLLQLRHSFDLNLLYGSNYGYRSGLNKSMVAHLKSIARYVQRLVPLKKSDLIIDIGSNDGTFLNFFPPEKFHLVGVDPTAEKFRTFYRDDILVLPTFFTKDLITSTINQKAKVITSIAMFYDLEEPLKFMKDIYDILEDDGIWLFEQSYTPGMIQNLAYDTICHEHLDYYCLKQIKWMADCVGFKIIDLKFNNVNGGSFCIVVSKKGKETEDVKPYLEKEKESGFDTLEKYEGFEEKIKLHKKHLLNLLHSLNEKGKKILGYGASTKGNVVLQYCNITTKEIPYIAEINEDKFGRYTPGTKIKIISEKDALALKPDYLLVLPWHFKEYIINKEAEYLKKGGKLIFPLPDIEVC